MDRDLILSVVDSVNNMPDRDEQVNEIKARIERGEYSVSSDDIVDSMIRRARADRIS